MARVLFVTSRLPWPAREGHQLRSWNLLRAAARMHEVTLLSLQRDEDGDGDDPVLRDTVAHVHTVALPPLGSLRVAPGVLARSLRRRQPLLVGRYAGSELEAAFRRHVGDADLVHFDMLPLAGLAHLVPTGIPVVLNEHNVESRLMQSQAMIEPAWWRRAIKRQQVGAMERFERAACTRADRVLACSTPDAELLRALAPAARVSVVPNGVDLSFFDATSDVGAEDGSLVFVGGMGWLPNRDGMEHFLAEGFPRIRAQRDTRLTVIGRRDGLAVPPALADSVHCTGFVDDLRPLVRRAAVYVVPLRAGSGTRLKILEAMALGKAIVSTRIGAEGIALRDGEHALLADSPEEFAAAVVRLLDDPDLRRRLGRAARRRAEREYGWEAIGERMLEVYAGALRQPPGTGLHDPARSAAAFG